MLHRFVALHTCFSVIFQCDCCFKLLAFNLASRLYFLFISVTAMVVWNCLLKKKRQSFPFFLRLVLLWFSFIRVLSLSLLRINLHQECWLTLQFIEFSVSDNILLQVSLHSGIEWSFLCLWTRVIASLFCKTDYIVNYSSNETTVAFCNSLWLFVQSCGCLFGYFGTGWWRKKSSAGEGLIPLTCCRCVNCFTTNHQLLLFYSYYAAP